MLVPGTVTDLAGAAAVAAVYLLGLLRRRQAAAG
jgi:uncharacterized protein (TIGR03382 family)